jgi:hypothetical protein
MRRKHAQVREQEPPLPAILAGDLGGAPVPLPESLVAPGDRRAAALLPDDLRVTIEGTGATRLVIITTALLVALVLGSSVLEWLSPDDLHAGPRLGDYLLAAVGFAALAWLAYRDLARPHKQFRLAHGGIVVEVWPVEGYPPRVTHVRWAEISDYTVRVDHTRAFLYLESVRGYALTLDDRPPRLSTREFIRRFVEQAERHPRAVPRQPRNDASRLPDVTGERAPALPGFLAYSALVVVGSFAGPVLDLSLVQQMAGIAAGGLIGLAVWRALEDWEIAGKDAESDRLIARLRRWLRRVLRIA